MPNNHESIYEALSEKNDRGLISFILSKQGIPYFYHVPADNHDP